MSNARTIAESIVAEILTDNGQSNSSRDIVLQQALDYVGLTGITGKFATFGERLTIKWESDSNATIMLAQRLITDLHLFDEMDSEEKAINDTEEVLRTWQSMQ